MENPYFSLLSTAWQYAKGRRKSFFTIYSMFVCANLVAAVNPFFYGWFVNAIQKDGVHIISSVWLYAAGFLGLRLLEWAFHGPARVMERELAFHLSKNYLDRLYNQLIHLPVTWHKDNHSGAIINRLRKAYIALRDFFQSGFVYLQSIMKFIISFVVMLYFSPLFGTVALVLGLFTFWVILKFDKPYIASLRDVNEAEHEVSSNLTDSLSNIITVITLRLEKRVHAALISKLHAVLHPFKRIALVNEWKWFTAQMLVACIYIVMIVGYVYQHYQPNKLFMLGGLVTLLGFVNQFASVFNDFAQQYSKVVELHTDVETAKMVQKAFAQEHRSITEDKLPVNWQVLQFKGLCFSHPKSSTAQPKVNVRGELNPLPIWKSACGLQNLDFSIHRGQRIALIGESGCGKSTLLSLLRGLYAPTAGLLLVDGNVQANYTNIANSVTLFPQEPEIFEASFHYNMTLGLPFEEGEINRICGLTRLDAVLENLQEGVDSMIREKGANLSGGQKQRLALARGVLAAYSSSLILMDEPTSSMDPKTEKEIYQNLFREFQGKTVISSLHRLHLLQHFDYIFVLDKGVIAEHGTLDFLLENGEIFKKLWSHQQNGEPELVG